MNRLKYIFVISLLLMVLSGCTVAKPNTYSNDVYSIDVPTGWIVENSSEDLPDGVQVLLLYREPITKDIHSVNLMIEHLGSNIDMTADEYIEKSLEVVSKNQNYEFISKETVSLDPDEGLMHIFKSTENQEVKTIIQLYTYNPEINTGFILTGLIPNDKLEDPITVILENSMKSFRMTHTAVE